MKSIREPNRRTAWATAAILAVSASIWSLPPGAALAGKFNRVLSIGDRAPDWSGLVGTDGRKYALADFAEAQLVVVVFTSNQCPVATANQGRLIALQKAFELQGVRLLAICSNPGNENSLPAMRQRAEAEGYKFPYLSDADQAVAKAFGAIKTPTALVLDGDRRVRYMGAIDDHWQDAAADGRNYLRDAIEAVLAGQKVPVAETRPQGCEIPRADSKASQTTR